MDVVGDEDTAQQQQRGRQPPPGAVHSFRTPTLELASSLRFLATADVGDPISHSWTALPYMAEQCRATSTPGADLGPPFELGLHIGEQPLCRQ